MNQNNFLQIRQDQTQLFELVQTEQFLSALEKSANDPQSRQAAKVDFRGFLKATGVNVPENISVQFNPDTWGVCINLGVISICYSK
jgi:hypothetical protein